MDSEINVYDWGSVQVTKDGGASWQVVLEKFGDAKPWFPKSIVLDPSYAVEDFQFRFYLKTDSRGNFAGWYIDDVKVTVSEPYVISVPCNTIDGGIVAGYVYDANFPTEKLIGAKIATPATLALSSDHAGLYYMFVPTQSDPEDVDFTLSRLQYETKVVTHPIEQDIVNHKDFELGAGILSVDITNLEHTIPLHSDPEFVTLTLNNDGAGSANFEIYEAYGINQPYSIPPFTAKIQNSDEPASINRDPDAAGLVSGLELAALTGHHGITAAPPAYGVDLVSNDFYRWDDVSIPGVSTLVGTPDVGDLFAGDFMGSDFSTLYAISKRNHGLYAIDTTTAEATFIAPTAPPVGSSFSGLASAPGIMYGVATNCSAASTLMEVDIQTGATITIGTLPNATCLIDIAYVPNTGMLYGVDLVTDSLYRIDPATGIDTLVGILGPDANFAQGMDYDEHNEVLYWAAYTMDGPELRIIDINTGASAVVGAFTQEEVDSFAVAAAGDDIPWLDVNPNEGYIPSSDNFAIQVEFNVEGIEQPGDFSASLRISSDTPYPVPSIPVTLHVVRPSDYGSIVGNITATGKCDVDPVAFTDARVNFYKDGELLYFTDTDDSGHYNYALKNGVYDVEVVAEGYATSMQNDVVLESGEDFTVDFVLRLLAPCLIVQPESFYQELIIDETATQTMTLINTGALEAPFEISEQLSTGPIPYSEEFDIELTLDDGIAEDAIGIGGTAEFMVLNRFTPLEDQFPFILERVDVSFEESTALAGDEIRIVVYQNTSGAEDPSEGAEFLYQQDAVVDDASGWNSYILDEAVRFEGPGDVLIGVILMEKPGSAYFPASIDESASQERSWVGWWSDAVPSEPVLPPDSNWFLSDDEGFPGNWLIRGMGSAEETGIVWLSEDPMTGVVSPDGGSIEVNLTFDSTGLDLGDYYGILQMKNPTEQTVSIPVQLRVVETPPVFYIFLPLMLK